MHESIPAILLDHSAGGITYTRFEKGYDVNRLAKVIEMIHYDDALVIPLWDQGIKFSVSATKRNMGKIKAALF